jgi:hypothetical protein
MPSESRLWKSRKAKPASQLSHSLDYYDFLTGYGIRILRARSAERAAQINLGYAFRKLKKDNSSKKPGKMWVTYDYLPIKTRPLEKRNEMERELNLIRPYFDKWDIETIPNGRPLA